MLAAGQSLPRELSAVRSDLEEKEARIEKIKEEIKAAKYEDSIQETTNKILALEEQRDALNTELRNLTLQADSRAKLDINRSDLSKKKRELQTVIDVNAPRFKKLVGKELGIDNMESDVDRAIGCSGFLCSLTMDSAEHLPATKKKRLPRPKHSTTIRMQA